MSRGLPRWAPATAAALAALIVAAPAAGGDRVARTVERAVAPLAQLDAAARVAVPGGGSIVRFSQRVGGLPVFGAEAVVASPDSGAPILVADETVTGVDGDDAGAAISRGQAIAAALEATNSPSLRAPAQAKLGIEPKNGRMAWEVSLPAGKPFADFLVVVDARNGEALSSRDVLWNFNGAATVFNPNPVVQQASYSGLKDSKDKDSDLLTSLLLPVTLPNITSTKGCLKGVYADARLGKKAEAVCSPNADFTGLTRADNEFEAVMSYFHIDRTRAYVDSLGLSKPLRSKPQKVRANGIPDDNSFYSSMTQSMTLGTGGVDDAEDADVIVHEYGHSLQDQAVKNYGRTVDAASIGEGFGDYLAAAMSALTTGGSEFDACIFDWDGVSYSNTGCGRTADRSFTLKKAESACFQEVHCLGEVWSSTLFELRQTLGVDSAGASVMDRVTLESNFMLTKGASFKSASKALLAADELLYAGAHVPAIQTELTARKFCKATC